jgi:DNA-binding transcriptional ArsR family regulator
MTDTANNLYDALERIFHEPNRLAIMSALCATREGLAFNDLKEACNLTDGNLNRHLKVLEEAGVIRIQKAFINAKPRTTIVLSAKGLERFNQYLEALSAVLKKAQLASPAKTATPVLLASARKARA